MSFVTTLPAPMTVFEPIFWPDSSMKNGASRPQHSNALESYSSGTPLEAIRIAFLSPFELGLIHATRMACEGVQRLL